MTNPTTDRTVLVWSSPEAYPFRAYYSEGVWYRLLKKGEIEISPPVAWLDVKDAYEHALFLEQGE